MVIEKGKLVLSRHISDFEGACCFVKATLEELRDYLWMLHETEIAFYRSLKYDNRKASYLLGRIAAKNAVSLIMDHSEPDAIIVEAGIFDFPVIRQNTNHNIQVSISHCDEVGIALAFPEAHPMAIDIERADHCKSEAMKSQITENEIQLISTYQLPERIACTILWTIKEALSKVLRTGLMIDYKILEVNSMRLAGTVFESTFLYFGQYKAVSLVCGEYVCTLVLPQRTGTNLTELQKLLNNIVHESVIVVA